MTWPEPGSGISANLAESLISIKVKNVARPGLLAVGSICPNTKEEEKEQQEEDQRAKPQTAKPQSPPNPPIRIHCTNGNYAYLTEAVLWGQGGIVRTTKNGIDMEIKLMRELGEPNLQPASTALMGKTVNYQCNLGISKVIETLDEDENIVEGLPHVCIS